MIKLPDTEGLQDRVRLSEQTGPGPRLRAAREASGYEIDDIAKQLRLHPHVIADLERDTFADHLALVFVRGYLRSYAGLIGLDPDQVVKEFNALGYQEDRDLPDFKGNTARSQIHGDQSMGRSGLPPALKWGAIAAITIVLGGVFIAYNYEPQEVLNNEPVKIDASAMGDQGLDTSGAPTEEASVAPTDNPAMSNSQAPVPGQAQPNSGRPVVRPAAPGAAAATTGSPASAAPSANSTTNAATMQDPQLPKPNRAPIDDEDN
jgi:cytoskeleton protein RodZ